MGLIGANLVGGNPAAGRTELDYYATNPEAVNMLISAHKFEFGDVLEPCVGAGHIANVIKETNPSANITAIDIVDRGYPNTIVTDFLNYKSNQRYDTIITNPPYSLASEFIYKSIELLKPNGQLAMFMKINFLEGVKRKQLYDTYPPAYLYVFRRRMRVFNNGQAVDPKSGKPWATTLCNAWYVWKKGVNAEPVIRWI